MESQLDIKTLRQFFDFYDELKNVEDDVLFKALGTSYETYYNINKNRYFALKSYERLEFLGDSVLDLVVSSLLYNNESLRTPGDLTTIKSKIVNNVSLACFINNICPHRNKNCADLFETLIAIVYLHTNYDIHFVTKWLDEQWHLVDIINYVLDNPTENNICDFFGLKQSHVKSVTNLPQSHVKSSVQNLPQSKLNFKTQLSNYYNYYKFDTPVNYIVINKPGQHNEFYSVGVLCPKNIKCGKNLIGIGRAKLYKQAEELASQEALSYLINFV
jgi:dsRNA-specific ribonuclease